MKMTAMLFLLSGAQGAVSDNIGRTAFSDEQRHDNVFVYVLSHCDVDKHDRARTLEWCDATRAANLPHCNASYTNSSNG